MTTLASHRRGVALIALTMATAFGILSPEPVAAQTRFSYVFPVVGHAGYAHKHHDYPATDIIADCGLPVVAAVDGVVLELSREDLFAQGVRNGSTRGGKFVSIRGDDGVRYYNSHLSSIKKWVKPGVRVTAGQRIGSVGRTGRAGSCHLHFGISPVCAGTGDWWIRRGVVWPWPYLDSWRKAPQYHRSPRREVREWKESNGCPDAP